MEPSLELPPDATKNQGSPEIGAEVKLEEVKPAKSAETTPTIIENIGANTDTLEEESKIKYEAPVTGEPVENIGNFAPSEETKEVEVEETPATSEVKTLTVFERIKDALGFSKKEEK